MYWNELVGEHITITGSWIVTLDVLKFKSVFRFSEVMALNSNIRCIEIALVADEIIPSIRLNSNIRCIEI